MTLHIETIPVLSDNYAYLVICKESGVAAAVDPADAQAVLTRAEALGVRLTAIWNTHHHGDHVAGNEAILAKKDLPVYAHTCDVNRVPGFSHGLEQGSTLSLGTLSAHVLHTPGHTRGGITYVVQDAAFTGDALFGAGCGRLFEGDAETAYHSLNTLIGALPDQTRIFFGHEYTAQNLAFAHSVEPANEAIHKRIADVQEMRRKSTPTTPSTLGLERETNPFLRCTVLGKKEDAPAITKNLPSTDPSKKSESSPAKQPHRQQRAQAIKVFADLRAQKDRF